MHFLNADGRPFAKTRMSRRVLFLRRIQQTCDLPISGRGHRTSNGTPVMMNILNSDPTLLMIGAGGLLVVLVVIFQIMTRPPAQKADQTGEGAGPNETGSVRILSRKALDDRRSLVTIRFGHSDHLLLLGDEGDLLIETRPTPLRERHSDGHGKARTAIPMPFPPQPVAKLNTRSNAEYQTAASIAVPEFLQTRAGQPAYAQPPQAATPSSQHPVMPQAVMRPAAEPVMPQPVIPQPLVQQPSAYPAAPAVATVNPTDEVTRKLEEAMRQAHPVNVQAPQPQAPIPHTAAPASQAPAQGGAYAASGPEAFEDEIRKLLGRGPHAG